MKTLIKIMFQRETWLKPAEAVIEAYDSSLVGGVPARGNDWHVQPYERRDRRPYYTKILYEENVEELKRKISRLFNEKSYIIEYIEV